jgi:hypothetical protein
MFEYAEIILKLVFSVMAGMMVALFSYFLDYCFWPGSIFKNYLPWLSRTLVKKYRKKEYNLISQLPKDAQENEFLNTAQEIFIYKVLGGCCVCMNIYIASDIFVLLWAFLGLSWWFYLPYVLSGSAFLRKLVKATY